MYYALTFLNEQEQKSKEVFTQVNDIGIFTFYQLIVGRKVPGKVNMVIRQEEKNGYKFISWKVVDSLPIPRAIHLAYTVHKSEKKKLRAKVKDITLNDLYTGPNGVGRYRTQYGNFIRLAHELHGILEERYPDGKNLDGDDIMKTNIMASYEPTANMMSIVRTASMLMAMQLELTKDEFKFRKEDFDAMISEINYGLIFKDPNRAITTENWLYDENGQQYRVLTNFYCSWEVSHEIADCQIDYSAKL